MNQVINQSEDVNLNIVDHKLRIKGMLQIRNCSIRNFYTFLDLHIRSSLNLVPVIAVDFSLANLTFNEECYCLHSLK